MSEVKPDKNSKVVVIGAGVAGLAAAIRLQSKGYDVVVVEANVYPGGKLTQFVQGAYRFDAGPSLFTMPQYVDELFELTGRNPKDYFNYTRKSESCRYFWNDATHIIAYADHQQFANEIEKKLGVKAVVVKKKLLKSKQMYELAGRTFLEKPLNHCSTWISKDIVKALFRLHSLSLFNTMHQENVNMLKNPKLVQLFDRYATYNGSDPYKAPGVLNIIPHLEHGIGTFHPVKGMHQITESLFRLAKEIGVTFRFNEKAEQILVSNGAIEGVKTNIEIIATKMVISNMDVTPTYRKLLPDLKAPERTLNQERSSSALIFYWGIKTTFSQLGLHNIFFSNDYHKEFKDIFSGKVPAEDPTVYVNITSKDVPSDAPEDHENWFVMVNVPQHKNQNWQTLIPAYRQAILKKLNPLLHVDLSTVIENESTLTPLDIELKTSSLGGSLYGTSSNSRYAAFLRHANESSRVKGLYFCGGSVHPGGGIPLCLLSAKIVSEICPKP
ncbi:MAG: phytoene desaturase [Bacteroidetes bacterium HGW-Bacteroidetes-1]|jgi:phytoene desaturase|nr:MAG: phytoene desaturase [Bacteroidetes bacterium HGW-Bacteroidetes-1]